MKFTILETFKMSLFFWKMSPSACSFLFPFSAVFAFPLFWLYFYCIFVFVCLFCFYNNMNYQSVCLDEGFTCICSYLNHTSKVLKSSLSLLQARSQWEWSKSRQSTSGVWLRKSIVLSILFFSLWDPARHWFCSSPTCIFHPLSPLREGLQQANPDFAWLECVLSGNRLHTVQSG